jgi:hypothetical protein
MRESPRSRNLIMAALTQDFPVVIGFSVYDSFESQEVARTGIVPMPETSENLWAVMPSWS